MGSPSRTTGTAARRRWAGLVILATGLLIGACGSPSSPRPTAGPARDHTPSRLVGYFPAWSIGARNYHVADIPVGALTHVVYAFADVSPAGECVSGYPKDDGINVPQLAALEREHPRLRTLISVGGAAWSPHFPPAVSTSAAREHLAESCVSLMRQDGFDGIDVDWEFPSGAQEKARHADLLAALRTRLDRQGRTDGHTYLLTIAAPAGAANIASLDLPRIAQAVDWINLMAYDFATGTSPITNFNAPLHPASDDPSTDRGRLTHNAEAAVQAYLDGGVPRAAIVLGVPFSGRGWSGVPDQHDGLYQPFTGIPAGTWGADGVFDYRDLEQRYLPTYVRHWHAQAQVPWLYSPGAGVMISYDDPQSMQAKAAYVRAGGLGGMMIWQLAADDAQHSLVDALASGLRS